MDADFLGPLEWLGWAANALLCGFMLARSWFRREPIALWSPAAFVGAIYLYYVVVGPMVTRMFGSGLDRGVDMRPYFGLAWTGAVVALLSWLFGYYVLRPRVRRSPGAGMVRAADGSLWRLGMVLNTIGFFAYITTAGLSGFRAVAIIGDDPTLEVTYSGAFTNYLALCVNFLIAGCSVLFLARLRGRGSWGMFAFWMALAVITYVTMGFRYRLVLLAGGLTFIYYLHYRKRPNLLLFMGVATLFVAAMGIIGQTRTYGSGLDLSRRSDSVGDSLLSGFGETVVFGTSGAVIHHVPSDRPLVWWEPIKQTLVMPVPSRFFSGKATNAYLIETLMTIYGPNAYQGAAYMLFAEVYLMFWWPGVIIVHVALGWGCRLLWEWYRARQHDPLALVVYAAALPYLYVVYSRGYLPQVVMLFFFSVAPAIMLYRWPKFVTGIVGRTDVPSLRPMPRGPNPPLGRSSSPPPQRPR